MWGVSRRRRISGGSTTGFFRNSFILVGLVLIFWRLHNRQLLRDGVPAQQDEIHHPRLRMLQQAITSRDGWWQQQLQQQQQQPQPPPAQLIKAVDEVLPSDSCICWHPDACTCGMQQCPYLPPLQQVKLPTEEARTLFEVNCLPSMMLSTQAMRRTAAPPLSRSMLRRYNKRLSTQLIGPLYQFSNEHYALEGAKRVLAAGGDSYKFRMRNEDKNLQPLQDINTISDLVRNPSLPYAEIFDLPLTAFFFWVYPRYTSPFADTYELAAYLIKKYQQTGKAFFIGMWEGDNAMRDPDRQGKDNLPSVERIQSIMSVVQEKQRAVDAAKRDLASCKGVYVWNYIETNYVIDSVWDRGRMSIANYFLTNMDDPPVDYVSYSAYEVMIGQPQDWKLQNFTTALDYLAQRLPPKPDVPGPRVFMGEWSYPWLYKEGTVAYTPEATRIKGLYAAAVAIAWGSQFNTYWQLYSNVKLANGTGDRGYHLVNSSNVEMPLWEGMQAYFAAAQEFLQRFWSCFGGWPSDFTYRVWAVKALMKIIGNASYPEPQVRDLTGQRMEVRIIADNIWGQYGATITEPSAEPPLTSPVAPGSPPPLVPLNLGADRGRCPLPLPMLPPSLPVPANTTLVAPASAPSAEPAPWQVQPPQPSNGTCGSFADIKDQIQLAGPLCPISYPKITLQDVVAGRSRPYTYGGIDRLGCVACHQKGLWPRFCLWRRTEVENWDRINCNQRESYGRVSVEKNLQLSSDITAYWPGSSGIPTGASSNSNIITPGPAEITPCDVWRLIRGRTLWIIGDSEMKGLFLALKCFMLEFWDLKQFSVSWNESINSYLFVCLLPPDHAIASTPSAPLLSAECANAVYNNSECLHLFLKLQANSYLASLPYNAEAKCIHMPDSSRICQLKVLWADVFVLRPKAGDSRWSTPVMELLHSQLAAPEDIFALNFGLWYDSKNPSRYQADMEALGRAYQATKESFPNVFFLETVKLHWPGPPGDQDGGPSGDFNSSMGATLEQCSETSDVAYSVRDSSLLSSNRSSSRKLLYLQSVGASCQQTCRDLQRVAEAAMQAAQTATLAAHAAASAGLPPQLTTAAHHASTAAASAAGLASLAQHKRSEAQAACMPVSSTTPVQASVFASEMKQLLELLHHLSLAVGPATGAPGSTITWLPAATSAAAAAEAAMTAATLASRGWPIIAPGLCSHLQVNSSSSSSSSSSNSSSSSGQRGTAHQSFLDRFIGLWARLHQVVFQHSEAAACIHVARRHLAAASQHGAAASGQNQSGIVIAAFGNAATAYASAASAYAAAAAAQALEAQANANKDAAVVAAATAAAANSAKAAAEAAQKAQANAAMAVTASTGRAMPSPSPQVVSATPSAQPPTPPQGSTAPAAQSDGVRTFPTSSAAQQAAPAVMSPQQAADAVLAGLWRNKIARAVLRDTYNLPWIPIFNATVPPYWGHRNQPQTPDCIHFCNPGVPQNWLAQLALAIAQRVQPLEGQQQVADKRCLWGSTQVFDAGEADFANK